MINLAHGSLYMIGAYLMATIAQASGSFWVALPLALICTALIGMALEMTSPRPYRRINLSQVLATFALILIADELVRMIWGRRRCCQRSAAARRIHRDHSPARREVPRLHHRGRAGGCRGALLAGREDAGRRHGAGERLQPRDGARARRGREAAVHARFRSRRGLCALAGAMLLPLLAVQVGMGENILIQAFVVVVIGGIGSIRGAGRRCWSAWWIPSDARFCPRSSAASCRTRLRCAGADAAMAVFILMAAVLYWRQVFSPARGGQFETQMNADERR